MITIFGNLMAGMGGGSTDTTADGKQVFVIIGDSKTGTSPSAGPSPSAGTVYEWDAGAVVDVGADDLTGTTIGSPWPRCGINYNAGSGGKKPVFVYCGSSGSTYSTHGTGNSWNVAGNLYAPMKVKVNAALAALGLTKPKAIFIILGINDSAGAVALATVQSDIQSLYTRLTADFGGCDIVASIPSRGTTANAQRLISIRSYITDESFVRSNVHTITGETAFREITGLYTDNLHYNATGNDWMGIFYSHWLLNSTMSKFGRSFVSSMFTDIIPARKALLDTCVSAEFANGNLQKYEWFYWFKNTTANDVWIDFAGNYSVDMLAFAFTANSHITSSGTARINPGFVAGLNFARVTQNDIFIGAKIKTRVSSGSANATIFGVSDAATDTVMIAQTSTPSLVYAVNDQTLTAVTSPDASLQNDTFYAALRADANNKSLIKNGSIINTAAVASTGEPSGANLEQYLAVKNQNASIVNALAAEFEFFVCAKGNVNYADFYNNWEAVSNGW